MSVSLFTSVKVTLLIKTTSEGNDNLFKLPRLSIYFATKRHRIIQKHVYNNSVCQTSRSFQPLDPPKDEV